MKVISRQELSQSAESSESKNRRLLFDRVRQNLSDLMMTADEKNHVISNANEELDRQVIRLDAVFPYIAGEISEEARMGSLTHWAYSNKSTAKAATNERPRREAVAQRQDLAHVLQEAEAASRSEARRDAVLARKQRRGQVDADYEETRSGGRKTNHGKSRGGDNADSSAAPKRRKVERPAVETSVPMDRSASGAGSQRAGNKDPAEKKRSRAPNSTAAARKKYVPFNCAYHYHSANVIPGPILPMLHRQFWPRRLWSEPSMPRGVPPAQDPMHQGHNLHELSSILESQAMRARDRHRRLLTAPTTVCRFNHLSRTYSLTICPTQIKLPIPDLFPEMDPPKMTWPMETHIGTMKATTSEHPLRLVPSAKIWKASQDLSRRRPPRDVIPRRQHLYSLHMRNLINVHAPREAKTRPLQNEPRRNPSHSLQYPLTMSRSMRAMTKMRRVSLGTATAMKSVSGRWLLAITMPVRASGSIYHVWA